MPRSRRSALKLPLFGSDNASGRKKRRLLSHSRLNVEPLEERRLLAFMPGSIQGQEGWSGGTIAIAAAVDQTVVQPGTAFTGVGSWRISNNTSLGNHNGAFSGWPFGPGLSVTAGQPSSGAGANQFNATYYFRSANTVADGSNIEVDLGTVPGDDRNTFMAITNDTDGDGGLKLRMAEPNPGDPGNDYFYPTQIVATGISRGVWHRIDVEAKFYDGVSNDTFSVSLDGTPILNPTPGSPNNGTALWGTFEGYRDGHGFPYALSNRLFFRSGAAPNAFDATFVNTDAQGFYFDNVSYQVSDQTSPSVALNSYVATFEGQPGETYAGETSDYLVTNDVGPVGLSTGDTVTWNPTGTQHPQGAVPGLIFDTDAFTTIQGAVNAASVSGTVYVTAGTYSELVNVNKQLSLQGAQVGVDARTRVVPITDETVMNSTSGAFFLNQDNITLDGFLTQNTTSGAANGGAAIATSSVFSGHRVRNNIIQDNIIGMFPASNGVIQSIYEQNWIRDNDNVGPAGGTGLYTDTGLSNALIRNNKFSGNHTSLAANINLANNIMVTGNEFNDGDQLRVANVDNSTISGNNFVGSTVARVGINSSTGNDNLIIDGNTFTNRRAGAISAIAGSNLTITNNVLTQDVTALTAATRNMILVSRQTGVSNVSGNTITLTGVIAVGGNMHGIEVSGNGTAANTGTVNVTQNVLNGGNVDAGTTASDSTGINVFGSAAAAAVINVMNNDVSGFVNGVVGLNMTTTNSFPTTTIFNNDLSGNSTTAVTRTGGTFGTLNASANWYGTNTPAGVDALVGANIDYTPWLNLGTEDPTTGAAFGFQGDFSSLQVDDTSPQTGGTGRIQEGVNLLADGSLTGANRVVNVAAGVYAETVTIAKPLDLNGAQVGNDADTRFAAFTGGPGNPQANPAVESIITAAVNNPIGNNPGAEDLIRVLVDGITIDGLVLDGNNPNIAGASAVQTNFGVDIDARRAITNIDTGNGFNPVSNLLIQHNIMQNLGQRGVSLANNGPVSTGNLITDNVIRQFGYDPVNGGQAVILFTNAYADITNNTIEVSDNNIGLHLQNFFSDGTMTWSGNNITVGQDSFGIHANLFYAPAGVLNLTSNTVNAAAGVTGASGFTWGINVWSVQVGSTVNVTGNTVGSSGGEFARGINLWSLPTANTVTVSGGSVGNTVVGIQATNNDPFFGAGAATQVNISGVTVTGATTAGILVEDNDTATISATINNDSSISGSPAGILVQGSDASANVTGNDNTITGNVIGIDVNGGSASVTANTITANGTGIRVINGGMLTAVTNNFITNQTTMLGTGHGIDITASAGSISPIFENDLSGNLSLGVNNANAALINASGNWWGTNTAAGVAAEVSPNVDYTPWLAVGTEHPVTGAAAGFQGDFSALYVDDNSPQSGATGRIQEGINLLADGSLTGGNRVVNVLAGTYKENVAANKAGKVVGPNAGIAGNGARVAEAVVVTNGNQFGAIQSVFAVSASNVTIQGLTIDGDDPMVAGAPLFNGADANTLYGVRRTAGDSLSVLDNVLKNTFIGVRGDGVSNGSLISNNYFKDIGAFDFGYGVTLRTGSYADITNNVMERVWTGVHINDFSLANVPNTWTMSGNNIKSYAAGLWFNQSYSSATPLAISNNEFSRETGAVANNIGILVTNGPGAVGGTYTGNTITGHDYGVIVWGTSAPVILDGTNSITNSQIAGVYLTNNIGFNPIGTTALNLNATPSSVTLDGITISTSAAGATGVIVRGDSGGGASTLTAQNATTISGGLEGLRLNGSLAMIGGNTLNNTAFTGQSGNYITLVNGAYDGSEFGATGASFDGGTGAGNTLVQNYAVEDKIVHAVDDPSVGLVRVKAANVFTTPASFVSPATAANIQNAVDASVAADTLNIKPGSYTGNVDINEAITINPGTSPGIVNVTGDWTFSVVGSTLALEVNGTTPGPTGHDQINVSGTVDLNGADNVNNKVALAVSSTTASNVLDLYDIITSGAGPIQGEFSNPGDTVVSTGVVNTFFISYNPGSNLVRLVSFSGGDPATTYADDDWTGFANGQFIVDVDPVMAGNQNGYFEVNAFETIQDAVDAVTIGGTVKVNSHGPNAAPTGAYAENVSISKDLTLDGNAISGLAADVVIDPAAGNGIDLSGASTDPIIQDLRVTGAVNGINSNPGSISSLTLSKVEAISNSGSGIFVNIVSGAVQLSDVTADGNTGGVGVLVFSAASATVDGGSFSNNSNVGLDLRTISGAVQVTSVTVDGNGLFGMSVSSAPSVTVDGTSSFSNGGNNGIALFTISGAAHLTNVTADGSTGGVGLFVFSVGSLTVDGTSSFSNNHFQGLAVSNVTGALLLTNVTADSNGADGLVVNTAGSVTINGTSSFSGNTQDGIQLKVVSGAVQVVNVTADDNDFNGLSVGQPLGSAVSVSVSGGSFSDNDQDGINLQNISSFVTISGATVEDNGGDGVDLLNVANATFEDNIVSGHNTAGDDGLRLNNVAGISVLGSTFTGNYVGVHVQAGNSGVEIGPDTVVAADSNTFNVPNLAAGGGLPGAVGVLVSAGQSADIQNNLTSFNGTAGAFIDTGILLDHAGDTTIDGNTFNGLYQAIRILGAAAPATTVFDIISNHFNQGGRGPGIVTDGLGIVITGDDAAGTGTPAKVQINGRGRDMTHNVFRDYSGPIFGSAGYAVTLRDFVTGQIGNLDYDALCNDWHAGPTPPEKDDPARIEDMVFDKLDDSALGRLFAVSVQVVDVQFGAFRDLPGMTSVRDLQILPREVLPSTIVDDGDAGFASSVGFTLATGQGFQSDVRFAAGDNSGDAATWSFTGLTPGEYVELAVTWSAQANRATNAPFSILDNIGGTVLLTTAINQQVAPNDFFTRGVNWEFLTTEVQVPATGTLVVRLTDNANNFVIADAVRLQRTRQYELVQVTYYQDVVNADNVANYQLVADGVDNIHQTIPYDRTMPAPPFGLVVGDDRGIGLAAVPQTPFLGVVYNPATKTATLAIAKDLDIDHYRLLINADPTTGVRANTNNPTIDAFLDGDGDNCDIGDDFSMDFTVSRRFDFNMAASVDDPAQSPTQVPYLAVQPQLVFASANDLDGYGWQVALPTNGFNRTGPDSLRRDGHFDSTTRTFRVDLDPGTGISTDGNGTYTVTVHMGDQTVARDFMQVFAEGSAVASLQNITTAVGQFVSLQFDVTVSDGVLDLRFADAGGSDAFWVINGVEVVPTAGQIPIVLTSPSSIIPGHVATISSQPIPHKPDGSLITVTPNLGVIVTPDAAANIQGHQVAVMGGVISFDIQAPLGAAATIIDNSSVSGFSTAGSWTAAAGQGYQNSVLFSAAGTGSDTATWTFNNLTPGQYTVSTTWSAQANRATNAPYTINGIMGGPTTVLINQELAPNDFNDQGVPWENLAIVTITGSTMTVQLSDLANEFVIADAVRIQRVGGPVGNLEITAVDVVGEARGTTVFPITQPADDLFFDLNSSSNATQPGYLGLNNTNNGFNFALGYGWATLASTFDRGVGMPDQLLRDGHFGSVDNTFRVQLDPAATYNVTLRFRDTFNRDNLQVFVEGAMAPTVNIASLPANTTNVQTFLVGPIGGDGVLDLRFHDNGGDPFWIINAIEIDRISPLMAAVTGNGDAGPNLTQSQVDAVLAQALEIWSTVVGQPLPQINVQLADLSGNLLGYANGNTITLDLNAAAVGWFIDSTPEDDSEFALVDGVLTSADPASRRYDLLTVLLHEVGHILGLDHDDSDASSVMDDILLPGIRKLPSLRPSTDVALIDKVLADWEDA